ncbi:MAG: hypothetical protein QNJ44_02465 [Rhodobacter sp.]|nr:hypothetical protein [Rhodobacter sp.]
MDDHWIMRGTESMRQQGDILGRMHPNAKGHLAIRDRLVDCILGGHCISTVQFFRERQ